MTCFCIQKRHQEETYVCGSKMIHGRFVEAGMYKMHKNEGCSGPRKDAEGFAEEVRRRLFCITRVYTGTKNTARLCVLLG